MKRLTIGSCENGSIAVITAFGAAAACVVVGIAILMAQGNLGKAQLQASLDAAVLGAISLPLETADDKRVKTAQKIFDANVAELLKPADSVFESIGSPSFAFKEGIVTGHATSRVRNGFTSVFGISGLDITQQAAARKAMSDPLCVLALSPSQPATIEIYGNAEFIAHDCAAMANSNDGSGLRQYGNNSKASASAFGVQGGYLGQNWSPKPETDVDPVKDPYANLLVPDSGPCIDAASKLSQAEFTLDPGTYCGGLSVGANAKVILNPGVYVFKDGPLSLNAGASVEGQEVLLTFVGADSYLYMLAQSQMTVTSPATGPYTNMQFMSDRDLSLSKHGEEWTTILSGATLDYDGVMYLPEQQVWISGTSHDVIVKANSPTLATVADKIWVQGNAKLDVTQVNRRNIDVIDDQTAFVTGAVLIR